uniref:Uncharacterized protein n=1 Tax=Arundo donax TaxID=35708 RepID=A0A0A9AZ28_ARUDO
MAYPFTLLGISNICLDCIPSSSIVYCYIYYHLLLALRHLG